MQKNFIIPAGNVGIDGVDGHPVSAPQEQGLSVDGKLEGLAVLLPLLQHFNRADAEALGPFIHAAPILPQLQTELVQERFAVGTGPPQAGVGEGEGDFFRFFRGTFPVPDLCLSIGKTGADGAALGLNAGETAQLGFQPQSCLTFSQRIGIKIVIVDLRGLVGDQTDRLPDAHSDAAGAEIPRIVHLGLPGEDALTGGDGENFRLVFSGNEGHR